MCLRISIIISLGLAMLLPASTGSSAAAGPRSRTYTVSLLSVPRRQPSEAWFVDNRGNVFGLGYNAYGSGEMCVWRERKRQPKPLSIPDDAAYYVMGSIMWQVRYVHMTNNDRMVYASETSIGVVDLLHGTTTYLPSFPGSLLTEPCDVNDKGICVGDYCTSESLGLPLPMMWSTGGKPIALPLPAGCNYGGATAINNRGQILGYAAAWDYSILSHLVVWNINGSITREIPLTPEQIFDRGATPLMISDNGYIVAEEGISVDLISPTGTVTPLAYPTVGGGVNAINAHGQVAGYDDGGPVVWNADGSVIRLPLPPDRPYCAPYDINDDGIVVGDAADLQQHTRAVIWTPRH
jgi:hypothetical protein